MIPLKIELTDYRSHAHALIDFAALNGGAAITGPTGVGKTSLLEAMLWCLYGQSRNGRTHDAVVRIGAEQCVVTTEVRVGAQVWRVTRKRSTRSGGKSELDLWRLDGADWCPHSGKNIDRGEDSTQQRINDALGITFETLIHGPVALQDDANRFARERPEGRREVLRQILGLDRYREFSLRAKRAGDQEQAVADRLRREVDDLMGLVPVDAQLGEARTVAAAAGDKVGAADANVTSCADRATEAHRAEAVAVAAEAERAKAREALPGLRSAYAVRRRATSDLYDEKIALDAKADPEHVQRVEDACTRLPVAEQAERDLVEALGEAREDAAQLRDLLARREELATRWRAADARHRADADAGERAGEFEASAAKVPTFAKAVEACQAQVSAAREAEAAAAAAFNAVEQHEDVVEARRALDEARRALDEAARVLTQAETTQRAAERAMHAANTEASGSGAAAKAAADALERLEASARRLADAPCAASAGWLAAPLSTPIGEACDLAGTCPLLGDARAAAAQIPAVQVNLAKLQAEAETAAETAAAAQLASDAASVALHEARTSRDLAGDAARGACDHEETSRRAVASRVREAWTERRTELASAQSSLSDAQLRLANAERSATQLDAAQAALVRATEAKDEAETIAVEGAAVRGRIEALESKRPLASVEAALLSARTLLAGYRALAGEAQTVRGAARALESTRAAAAASEAAEVDLLERIRALEQTEVEGEALKRQVERQAAEAAVVEARAELDVARAQLGTAQADVERLEALQLRVDEMLAQAGALVTAAALSRSTAEALAIAAIIQIEAAIPVIEREANRVLANVSTRGMRLTLDTQRTKGDGGQAETLDIVVRDNRGERPYESFSGGESFVISMALRLGLAKLLADRDGVPIEFLVIDEGGFGALSPDYIATMRDVIAALQTEFQLVLLVTHLDDVADALPCRITVSDGPDGSVVAVETAA